MSELEQLRQEAEQLKNQIRVSKVAPVLCIECRPPPAVYGTTSIPTKVFHGRIGFLGGFGGIRGRSSKSFPSRL